MRIFKIKCFQQIKKQNRLEKMEKKSYEKENSVYEQCLMKLKKRKSLSPNLNGNKSQLRKSQEIVEIENDDDNDELEFEFDIEESFDSCDLEVMRILNKKEENDDEKEEESDDNDNNCNKTNHQRFGCNLNFD